MVQMTIILHNTVNHGSGSYYLPSSQRRGHMLNPRPHSVGFVQTTWHWDRFSSKHIIHLSVLFHQSSTLTHTSIIDTVASQQLSVNTLYFLTSASKLTLGMAADQHANILVFWFWTNINIENITNQKEIAFSLWKVGKLRGTQKWLQMAFRDTGEHWKLGSATRVTLLAQDSSMFQGTSKYTLKECLHTIT